MFAPLVAYLFWERIKERGDRKWCLLRPFALAVGTFILVFLPQLLVNKAQFGGYFYFPYVLHNNNAADGFRFYCLPSGTRFLIGCNYLYLVLGVVGLMVVRDMRRMIILTFWAVPLVLFYCGYPCVGACPTRFIQTAYGGLLAAFVCCDAWPEMDLEGECHTLRDSGG